MHVEVALGALAALRAAKAQLAVVGGQVVVFDAAEFGQRAPAPAAGGGHGKQVAFHEGVGRFQLRLAHGAPAEPGHAVVAVLQRDARAAVGGKAQAQRGFFQRRFGHLHLHGGGDGGGGGVFVLALAFAALLRIDRDVGRVVIAAADQALLRVGQARLVIRLAHGQLRQPPGQKGGVAPVARDLHGAEPVQRAGVQRHAQLHAARGLIHIGLAAAHAACRIAFGDELAQRAGFGAAPRLLREALARAQRPVFADGFLLLCGGRVGGMRDVARKGDVRRLYLCLLARLHGNTHHGRLCGGLPRERDLRREIALRGQQALQPAFGQRHQAVQLGGVQIGHGLVAAQIVMALQQRFQLFVGCLHFNGEGGLFSGVSGGVRGGFSGGRAGGGRGIIRPRRRAGHQGR